MDTLFKKATLGLTLGAATLAAASPADAQRWRGGYRDRDNTGTAVVAGIAGLAIGAALTSGNRYNRGYDPRFDRGYDPRFDRGFNGGFDPRFGYDRRFLRQRNFYRNDGFYGGNQFGGVGRCVVRRVYDPYIGRRVRVRYC